MTSRVVLFHKWRVGITITIVFNPDHWDCLYKSSSICSRETPQTAALFSTMVSWFYPHIQRYTRCPQSYYPQQSQTIALPARIKWDDSLWEPKHNQHLWHEYYGLSDAEYPQMSNNSSKAGMAVISLVLSSTLTRPTKQPMLTRPSTHHMQSRFWLVAVIGTLELFAINGDNLCS